MPKVWISVKLTGKAGSSLSPSMAKSSSFHFIYNLLVAESPSHAPAVRERSTLAPQSPPRLTSSQKESGSLGTGNLQHPTHRGREQLSNRGPRARLDPFLTLLLLLLLLLSLIENLTTSLLKVEKPKSKSLKYS